MFPGGGGIFSVTRDPRQLNPLALAYMGDSVYEMLVRRYLLARGESKPRLLHRAATGFVSSKAQSVQLDLIWERLDEEERDVCRRGRNAKPGTVPKNADLAEYHKATAFEALIGYLYLLGRMERLVDLVEWSITEMNKRQNGAKQEWKS